MVLRTIYQFLQMCKFDKQISKRKISSREGSELAPNSYKIVINVLHLVNLPKFRGYKKFNGFTIFVTKTETYCPLKIPQSSNSICERSKEEKKNSSEN